MSAVMVRNMVHNTNRHDRVSVESATNGNR